jgi:hypothetical protein
MKPKASTATLAVIGLVGVAGVAGGAVRDRARTFEFTRCCLQRRTARRRGNAGLVPNTRPGACPPSPSPMPAAMAVPLRPPPARPPRAPSRRSKPSPPVSPNSRRGLRPWRRRVPAPGRPRRPWPLSRGSRRSVRCHRPNRPRDYCRAPARTGPRFSTRRAPPGRSTRACGGRTRPPCPGPGARRVSRAQPTHAEHDSPGAIAAQPPQRMSVTPATSHQLPQFHWMPLQQPPKNRWQVLNVVQGPSRPQETTLLKP